MGSITSAERTLCTNKVNGNRNYQPGAGGGQADYNRAQNAQIHAWTNVVFKKNNYVVHNCFL